MTPRQGTVPGGWTEARLSPLGMDMHLSCPPRTTAAPQPGWGGDAGQVPLSPHTTTGPCRLSPSPARTARQPPAPWQRPGCCCNVNGDEAYGGGEVLDPGRRCLCRSGRAVKCYVLLRQLLRRCLTTLNTRQSAMSNETMTRVQPLT